VGFPDGSQNACLEGETIPFTVKVFDADGQSPTYQWGDDKTTGGFDNPTAQTVNWKCPALSDGSAGGVYVVYVLVTDPDGQQDWGDTKVSVYPADAGIYDDYEKTTVTEVKTCSTTPGWAGVVASLLAGAAALRRRRA
jgi:MYXO-CTERM domain-containing protein